MDSNTQSNEDKRIKVEIRLQESGEWQWMGLMTDSQLTALTEYADSLSDGDLDV